MKKTVTAIAVTLPIILGQAAPAATGMAVFAAAASPAQAFDLGALKFGVKSAGSGIKRLGKRAAGGIAHGLKVTGKTLMGDRARFDRGGISAATARPNRSAASIKAPPSGQNKGKLALTTNLNPDNYTVVDGVVMRKRRSQQAPNQGIRPQDISSSSHKGSGKKKGGIVARDRSAMGNVIKKRKRRR
ncbi:MAG: hypothetical protein KDJ69_07595 [Nitratireductor sp.]|nr:hypothetical protein [Nitratireductor sp.]